MNKVKLVALIEAFIILILLIFLFKNSYGLDHSNLDSNYCNSHANDIEKCLLSSRVYAGILQPNSYLILNLDPLKKDIGEYITQNKFDMSVYVVNLRAAASFGINSNKSYPAISLNKLPLSVIILKKVEKGELSLDKNLTIYDNERDSSSGTLYSNPAKEMSIRELLRYMLQESDNTAFWVLQTQITKADLESLADYVDYYSSDIASEKPPLGNTDTNAKQVLNLFLSLYLSTDLNPEHSEMILSYLTNTSFDIKKYAKLPSDVVVAQKFGAYSAENISLFHSCGIIYVQDSRFAYCIMSKDIQIGQAREAVGIIVNKLYNFIIEKRNIKDLNI